MAGVISVGGLATGLDTNKIIDQLVALERRPLDLLDQQVADTNRTKSAITTVSAKLAALKTAAAALDTAGELLVRKASSSDDTVLAAAAGTGAQRGAATLTVTQLAHGSVAGSAVGKSAATDTVASGAGVFQFTVGTGDLQSVDVDGTTTLQGLATAINDLDAGVTASVINLGTTASPDYRLNLVSTSTGASSTITIGQDDTSLDVTTTQGGQNAEFSVSGFAGTFARESNTFSDVLPGVTFTLRDEGTSTVTVADDTDAITAKVKTLVAAYNDVTGFIASQSTVSQADDADHTVVTGSLVGDSTVRRLLSRVHESLSRSLAGATTRYVNLSSIGVASQKDGTLLFDEAKFKSAIADDADAVADLFGGVGDETGVATDIAAVITEATSTGGVLDARSRSLTDEIDALGDRFADGQRHLDQFEAGLRAQFAALETLVSGLQSQGNFLLAALGQSK